METKIASILNEFGLDEKENRTYLSLVENGELNAYVLAKLTGIHRSTRQAIIDRLSSKGFISKIEKQDKNFYSAVDITELAAKIKEKETLLLSLIPEFQRLKKKEISRVKVLESKEGQKQFSFNLFSQIMNNDVKEIFILGAGPSELINS